MVKLVTGHVILVIQVTALLFVMRVTFKLPPTNVAAQAHGLQVLGALVQTLVAQVLKQEPTLV